MSTTTFILIVLAFLVVVAVVFPFFIGLIGFFGDKIIGSMMSKLDAWWEKK